MKCLHSSGGRHCQLDEHETGEHDYAPPTFLTAVHEQIATVDARVAALDARLTAQLEDVDRRLRLAAQLDGHRELEERVAAVENWAQRDVPGGGLPALELAADAFDPPAAIAEALPLPAIAPVGRRALAELDVGGVFIGSIEGQLVDGRVRLKVPRLGELLVRPGKCLLIPEGWGG